MPFSSTIRSKSPVSFRGKYCLSPSNRNFKKIFCGKSWGFRSKKNVLWNEDNNPLLIDWESARKLNPSYEIVNAALDWSGITTEFNQNLFKKMITAYQQAGGVINASSFEASFYGVLGNWINWLVYNIGRSCSHISAQRTIGVEQVREVLPTITRLKALIPQLWASEII